MKQTAWHDIIESILFISKIYELYLVNNVSGHSPDHRLVKVTGLYVGIIWLVSVQRHLTIFSTSFSVDRSDHHLAYLWLNIIVHHQDVAISHVRFH